jgi:predicted transcriptional regulator YdeE
VTSQHPVSVQEFPPMKIVGISSDFISILAGPHANATQVIPELWGRLMAMLSAHQDLKLGWGIGAVGPAHSPRGIDGELNYFAGFVFDGDAPEGFESLQLSGGFHAVCEHAGNLATLPETTRWFFTEWLPKSGLNHREDFPLEIYDERYKGDTEDSIVLVTAPVTGPLN